MAKISIQVDEVEGREVVTRNGKQYVLVDREEFERLTANVPGSPELPPLPEPDVKGNVPAIAYMRAQLARRVIARRARLGWSQAELARRAGLRTETINRLETGKTTPDEATFDAIDDALTLGEEQGVRPDATKVKRVRATVHQRTSNGSFRRTSKK